MFTFSIYGCGHLGQTLAKLWHQQQTFSIGDIVNRHASSSQKAQDFIGAGTPLTTQAHLKSSDIWLIATPDDQLLAAANALLQAGTLDDNTIVFHCSGASSSAIFSTIATKSGCKIASVHPVHSFANPTDSIATFNGTYCAVEGDKGATDVLIPAFAAIGALTLPIQAENKMLYHAGSVIACNYLTTLLESALECFNSAGINRQQAAELLRPIVQQTTDNILTGSRASALTGPIARGDIETVKHQLDAINIELPHLGNLYTSLGELTAQLAKEQNKVPAESLANIIALLTPKNP